MKRVKLYTLNVEDVVVSGDFVEVLNFNREEVVKIRNSDEFVLPSALVVFGDVDCDLSFLGKVFRK